ncbi:TonB-linked SusC/RagA family outer membrane protein [Mariniflexile fucanivorans]|uniref:TonB-linked SusC/RagA family outer membrane protein n=1 Tax=Mariniflexile fucanivorans TaxID=264023 RepID=A0A4R1RC99_9FLAO|nr:SusC/RagA family TonB-linked outer membrane protein [Mariniflexile fucanivorans]TCL63455.1 TonB-linked SusC/RagA family outer membrane protein [Mariniflexile fucanivorans]
MKKKTNLFFLVFFTATCSVMFSQNIIISGTVTDASSMPLPGVNIQVKNSKSGTSTDFDGNYKISAKKKDILIFSFLGFNTKEVVVNGASLNISLKENTESLDEVVITSFGIKRSEKELGYSASTIKSEDINIIGKTNAISSLQGSVAGLQISKTSGSVGSGFNINIRGLSSMNPSVSSQPLIVVDGIAINNDNFVPNLTGNSENTFVSSSEKYSATSKSNDLNPEDIESYTILKGVAATALYGIRAANGAVIITTKKGKAGKASINISSSISTSNVKQTPELQTVFREGRYGRPNSLYTPDTATGYTVTGIGSVNGPYSWGVRYTDDSFTYNGTTVDLTNDKFYDPFDETFRTGIDKNVNFNISGASDKFTYFASVSDTKEDGTIPGTDYSKTTFRLNSGFQATDTFKIDASISYSNSDSRKPTGGDKSIMSALGYWTGSFPISDYLNPDGTRRNPYPGFIDNPLYNAEFSSLTEDSNRWIGNSNLTWIPKSWVTVNYSAQIDNYSSIYNRFVAPDLDEGSGENGFIINQNIDYTGLESNFLINFTHKLSENIGTSLLLGNQVSDKKWISNRQYGEDLIFPRVEHISNTQTGFTVSNTVTTLREIGVFGELKFDFYNKLFLTFTGRNDWISTLPLKNNSVFYPTASLAYDVHSLFSKNSDVFSFGKLRLAYAEGGNGTVFGVSSSPYFSAASNFPWSGVGGYELSDVSSDENLLPERTKGIELGADLRFINNRIRLDYAYYNNKVVDAIFPVNTPPTSGFTSYYRNAGTYTTFGHEFLLSGDIIKTKDFTYTIDYTYTTYDGEITDLPDDVPYIDFITPDPDPTGANLYLQPREGDRVGDIYGYLSNRTEDGQLILGSNGLPTTDFENKVIVGNSTPDFIMGFSNTLKWKGFNLNFLFEWKKGGDKYSWTSYINNRMGSSQYTMQFRETDTYVFDGVMADAANPGNYVTNTTVVDTSPTSTALYNLFNTTAYWRRNAEVLLQDASWVKLRNIGLSYTLNGNLISKSIDNITLSANANNILIWTPFDGYDPEGSDYSAGSNVDAFTGRSVPLAESYSFSVSFKF